MLCYSTSRDTVLKCQTLRCLKKKLAMIYLHERALTPETQISIYQFTTILITMAWIKPADRASHGFLIKGTPECIEPADSESKNLFSKCKHKSWGETTSHAKSFEPRQKRVKNVQTLLCVTFLTMMCVETNKILTISPFSGWQGWPAQIILCPVWVFKHQPSSCNINSLVTHPTIKMIEYT